MMYEQFRNTAPNNPWQYYPYWPEPSGTSNWNFQYNYTLTCPHCGAWLNFWSKYCPQCGKPLYETQTTEQTLKEIKELLKKIGELLENLSSVSTKRDET